MAFRRLIDYAKDNAVKIIIIAGDLFDGKIIRPSLRDTVLSLIGDAPEIDFLYLRGNHDSGTLLASGVGLPQNLKIFAEDWTYFSYGSITIAGVQMTMDNYADIYGTLSLEPYRHNIVVMHGTESAAVKDNYNAVSINKLAGKNIDYLALGDYHTYKCQRLDMRGLYCYSGCLEGRGLDETGEKGFVLLTCENGIINNTFVPFAYRMIHEISVNIADAENASGIESLVRDAVSGIKDTDIVRIVLCGDIASNIYKNIGYLQTQLLQRFFYAEIKDKTKLKTDPKDYADGVSLKSEFFRLVLADKRLSQDMRDKIIACGLAALKGEMPDL